MKNRLNLVRLARSLRVDKAPPLTDSQESRKEWRNGAAIHRRRWVQVYGRRRAENDMKRMVRIKVKLEESTS